METVTVTVPKGLLEAIANYLAERPYSEVSTFMDGFRHVEFAKDDDAKNTTE